MNVHLKEVMMEVKEVMKKLKEDKGNDDTESGDVEGDVAVDITMGTAVEADEDDGDIDDDGDFAIIGRPRPAAAATPVRRKTPQQTHGPWSENRS